MGISEGGGLGTCVLKVPWRFHTCLLLAPGCRGEDVAFGIRQNWVPMLPLVCCVNLTAYLTFLTLSCLLCTQEEPYHPGGWLWWLNDTRSAMCPRRACWTVGAQYLFIPCFLQGLSLYSETDTEGRGSHQQNHSPHEGLESTGLISLESWLFWQSNDAHESNS